MKFSHFEVNSNTRELFYAGEKVQIQNKSLELLLYLIKHKDRAVSKDELLEKLWDGRVVSESVLAHASTKLRAALKDVNGKGEIIRTVYGYGLQFVAEIDSQNTIEEGAIESPDHNANQIPDSIKKSIIIVASLILILIMTYIINNYLVPKNQSSTNSDFLKPKINFIAINSENQKDQWLLQGLTLYLNQVLAYSDNSMPLPLDQMQNKLIENNRFYAIDNVINTTRIENNLSLAYKQDDILESELNVPLEDLPKAINLINNWACNTILKSNEKCEASISPLTVNNTYLIESYLRGKAAMFNQSPKDAIKFFEVTLQQDKNFILARIALAQAHISLSEYTKAISQAQTVISLTENILIQHQANIIIGTAYFRQAEFKEANLALNKVVESNQSHISLKAMALLIMAEVSMETEELNKSYEMAKLSNEILLKLDLPIMVAKSLDVMGTIQMTIGDLKLSQQLLTDSLRIYEQLEYNSGMESVLSPLGLVMQSQGLLEASLAYGQQRQVIAEKIGDPIDIAGAHLHLANLLLEMGDYAAAMNHANKMWDIVILEDEPAAILLAYFIAGEIAREDGKIKLSLDKYKHALDLAFELEIQFRQVQILCTLGATSIDAKEYVNAKDYLDRCSKLADETNSELFQVVAKLYLSQLYKDQGLIEKSKSVLIQALDLSKTMENDHLMWEIYLELFEHYIETDVNKAETYLMNIPQGYKDDYTYMVNLARIELKRNNTTVALQILLEAKQTAKDNWTTDDQLLLKETQSSLNK